jgi:crossover junction endodeoxyribonuclease RuvC
MILAIDPGASGALVVLADNGDYHAHLLTPIIKVGASTRINGAAVAAFVSQYKLRHCYIERVAAMPGQGVSSTFAFGLCAGMVEGVVLAREIPLTLVTPQSWKKHFKLTGQEKDASRSRAVQLFPSLRVLDLKAKGQAVADALFIGLYGLALK